MITTLARTFKNGNSLALRLPKAAGLTTGKVYEVSTDGERIILTPAEEETRLSDEWIAIMKKPLPNGVRLVRPPQRTSHRTGFAR